MIIKGVIFMTDRNYIRLPLEGITNCRDLGGYAALNQSITEWHKLLRSSDLSLMTEPDKEMLYNYGVRTVIDLRSDTELKNSPNPLNGYKDMDFYHVNLLNVTAAGKENFKDLDLENDLVLSMIYTGLIKEKEQLGKVLQIILNSSGGVLYHCSAGKDRTGVVSMLLMGLLGVDKLDILANYEVSYTYIQSNLNEMLSAYPLNILKSDPIDISAAYDSIIENYGSFYKYFELLGFSENILKNFIDSVSY